MATIIRTDGTTEEVAPDKPDGTFSAERLREIVGGWIEIVSLAPVRKRMIVDEEGHIKEKPLNLAATEIYWANTRPGNTHPIAGDVVVIEWEKIQ